MERPVQAVKVLFLLAAVKGVLFALLIPPGQGPDEPPHVAHVLLYAHQQQFKIVGQNDPGVQYGDLLWAHMFWDSAVQDNPEVLEEIFAILNTNRFWELVEATPPAPCTLPEATRPDLIKYIALRRYTSPFYFFLASLPLKWLGIQKVLSQWFFLRLTSVALGLAVIGFTYATARLVWREEKEWPALAAAAFLAFLPQFSFLSAVVSPDNLVIFFSSATLYAACRMASGMGKGKEALFLVGLSLLCAAVKEQGIPVLLFALLTLPLLSGRTQFLQLLFNKPLLLVLVGLVIVWTGAFYLFGNAAAVERVWTLIEARFGDFSATFLVPLSVYARFFLIVFVSFWFSYGWAIYKMSLGWYSVFALVSVLGLLGTIWVFCLTRERARIDLRCATLSLLLFLSCFLVMLGVLGPGHEGVQIRHFAAALPAIAVLLTLSLWGITPERYRVNVLQAFILLMVFVNAVVVMKYLIPLFYLGAQA